MEKLDELAAGKTFKIVQRANGQEQLIFEAANRTYFRNLANKHLLPVCEIKNCVLKPYQVEMILTFANCGIFRKSTVINYFCHCRICLTVTQNRSTKGIIETAACFGHVLSAKK